MTPEELRTDYDWREAFAYASKPQPCAGDSCALTAATIDDVADVIARADGENDGDSWVGVFVLRDGRYLFLSAGCDYAGWDCQAGGSAWVATDYDALFQFGLGANERSRLNLHDRLDLAATREARREAGNLDVLVFRHATASSMARVSLGEWCDECYREQAVETLKSRVWETAKRTIAVKLPLDRVTIPRGSVSVTATHPSLTPQARVLLRGDRFSMLRVEAGAGHFTVHTGEPAAGDVTVEFMVIDP